MGFTEQRSTGFQQLFGFGLLLDVADDLIELACIRTLFYTVLYPGTCKRKLAGVLALV